MVLNVFNQEDINRMFNQNHHVYCAAIEVLHFICEKSYCKFSNSVDEFGTIPSICICHSLLKMHDKDIKYTFRLAGWIIKACLMKYMQYLRILGF